MLNKRVPAIFSAPDNFLARIHRAKLQELIRKVEDLKKRRNEGPISEH
jgi:hypothetical protein